mmetsp:Transcript_58473/g.104317  ORF Transcript_58473/g.104317 Transcript_58473/m.104317 type:complete len:201 (-) Transcript_58473:268-870(-)
MKPRLRVKICKAALPIVTAFWMLTICGKGRPIRKSEPEAAKRKCLSVRYSRPFMVLSNPLQYTQSNDVTNSSGSPKNFSCRSLSSAVCCNSRSFASAVYAAFRRLISPECAASAIPPPILEARPFLPTRSLLACWCLSSLASRISSRCFCSASHNSSGRGSVQGGKGWGKRSPRYIKPSPPWSGWMSLGSMVEVYALDEL